MRNPYNYNKGKIHPSPTPTTQPPPPATTSATFLSLLPAAILALAAALSPQDEEVLAYLISCCDRSDAAGLRNKASRKTTTSAGDGDSKTAGKSHGPTFECSCFRCYMTFWARWDASSNRHVIHEIIEAYEEAAAALTCQQKQKHRKRESAGSGGKKRSSGERRRLGKQLGELNAGGRRSEQDQLPSPDDASYEDGRGGDGDDVDLEKSAVRKIVSFVGDRIVGIFGGI